MRGRIFESYSVFTDYRAYHKFRLRVENSNRYALDEECCEFLNTFRKDVHSRTQTIKAGQVLVRAVKEYEEILGEHGEVRDVTGAKEDRLLPKLKYAYEGRANPKGVVVLYLASSNETAMSEIRPWIGETVSIARFKIRRDLRIADFTNAYTTGTLLPGFTFDEALGKVPISPEAATRAVWIDINRAFSQPTTRSDIRAEYAPTQILAEALKCEGFDGIVYRSSFGGEHGYNIVLFKAEDAEILSCSPFSIKKITINFDQCGNGWVKGKVDK